MKYQRLFTEQSFDKKKLKQEYLEFKKFVISNKLTESTTKLNEGLIPSGLKDKFAFIKNISKEIGVQVSDLIKLFLNKGIFILFAKMKWSIVELWKIVKAGFDLYKSLFETWAKFIRENKITKGIIDKTAEKIKLVDDFFEEHPNLKKIGGVVVAGLLVYIWLNATMVGHSDIDFDISTVIDALLGKFDLADLFLSESGLIMLTNFIVGKVTGLTFPYPGSDLAKFTFAVIFTLAKKVKVKLQKENIQEAKKEKVKSELNENFYKWFKGSKIVDSKGNPLICYHGSNKEISKFDSKHSAEGVFWFSSNKNKIESGESGAVGTSIIIPVYLSIKKLAGWTEYEKLGLGQIEEQGFDGIELDDDYIVFNPNQIKSIYNDGSFDSNDKNIYS